MCGKRECEIGSRTVYVENNYVTDFIKRNREGAVFLVKLLKATINSACSWDILNGWDETVFLTKSDMVTCLKGLDPEELITHISITYRSDRRFNKAETNLYGTVKWVLTAGMTDIEYEKTVSGVKIFRVSHFDNGSVVDTDRYLFHGSSSDRWYSIISSGVKVMSNTTLMSNAAVYGPGVYLSNSINTARGYARGDILIIGVFRTSIAYSDKCVKTPSIYVVPDTSKIQLAYLLVLNNKSISTSTLTSVGNLYEQKPVSAAVGQSVASRISGPRLIREKKILESNGFKITIPDDNNINVWQISVPSSNIDQTSILFKDMTKTHLTELVFEFRFPHDYPMGIPFVRVIRPVFKFLTGHITKGGAICLDTLTRENWSPALSVLGVISTIISVINDGDGALDMCRLTDQYSFSEAKDTFDRLRRVHGWHY